MVKETRKIQVVIGEAMIPVGELIYEKRDLREAASFRYHSSWIEHPRGFALSPAMPLGEAPYWGSSKDDGTVLPAPIADGTPDSWGRALIRSSKPHPTELDYLIGSDDHTRIGALRYLDEDGTPQAARRRDSIPKLVDLAEISAAARSFEAAPSRYAALRANLIGAAGSLGGARPKVNVEDGDGLWIAKLTSERDIYPVEKAEVMVLSMAAKVGLKAARARLINDKATLPVALIERFDRRPKGRLPYISAQTFLGLQGTEPSSYVEIADAMRQHGSEPIADMRELLGRMMFTVLISNYDDHLRNHGFLYDKENRWRLAPMFDVNPEPERGQNLKTAISVIHGNASSIEAVVDAAPFFEVARDDAVNMARVMGEQISETWKHIAQQTGMTPSEIKRFSPAFDHEEIEVAARLGLTSVQGADLKASNDKSNPPRPSVSSSSGPSM